MHMCVVLLFFCTRLETPGLDFNNTACYRVLCNAQIGIYVYSTTTTFHNNKLINYLPFFKLSSLM